MRDSSLLIFFVVVALVAFSTKHLASANGAHPWWQFSLLELCGLVAVLAVLFAVAWALDWGDSIFTRIVACTATGLILHCWRFWLTAKEENLL